MIGMALTLNICFVAFDCIYAHRKIRRYRAMDDAVIEGADYADTIFNQVVLQRLVPGGPLFWTNHPAVQATLAATANGTVAASAARVAGATAAVAYLTTITAVRREVIDMIGILAANTAAEAILLEAPEKMAAVAAAAVAKAIAALDNSTPGILPGIAQQAAMDVVLNAGGSAQEATDARDAVAVASNPTGFWIEYYEDLEFFKCHMKK